MPKNPPPQPIPSLPKAPPQLSLPLCLWSLLFLATLWRAGLALQLFLHQGSSALALGQGAIVVHGRRLDSLVGWAALLILFMTSSLFPTTLKQRRLTRLFTGLASLGILLTAANIASDEFAAFPGAPYLGHLADLTLAAAAIPLVLRELRSLATELSSNHLTLLHLWRILTTQWTLAWIGATLYLRFTLKNDQLLGNDAVRQLLFALPALGLLLNTLMAAGIHSWSASLTQNPAAPRTPRARAWLLALFATNLGALAFILKIGSPAAAPLGIIGASLLLFGIAMYLLGFPKNTFSSKSGSLLLAAWLTIALAIALALAERLFLLLNAPITLAFWNAAWRSLLASGALVLWLLGLLSLAQSTLLPPAAQRAASRPLHLALLFWSLGTAITTALLLAASLKQGESQTPLLRWLFLGSLPQLIALLIGGALLLRTARLLRRSPSIST